MSEMKTAIEELNSVTHDWVNLESDSISSNDFYNFFINWAKAIRKIAKEELAMPETLHILAIGAAVFYTVVVRFTKLQLLDNKLLHKMELNMLSESCALFCGALLQQLNEISPYKVIFVGVPNGHGIMVKDESNDEDPKIRVIVGGLDPRMMEFLPPEIREAIQKDLGGGNGMPTKQEETPEPEKPKEKIKFDFGMTNCNQDLKDLTEKLKNSKQTNYGILLYGESGSGKSFYGQYLAQELGMPIIKKRASDLIDKWVGATEKNIQAAFKEAREKKAVLLFDEADSFLFDRKYAQRDFECASTNELLTQMEDHPYPFIMTTNLKEKIDKASLRRFLFKIKYDYMNEKNVVAGIKTYFGKQFKLKTEELEELKYLCAGDFKVAKRKMDVLENGEYSNEKIYEYLLAEQKEKDIKTSTPLNI